MVSQSISSTKVCVPATSANLGPGFDALGLAFDLWNEVELQISPQDALEVEGEGVTQLQGISSTIAHRAAHQLFALLDLRFPGVRLRLKNAIPLSRGLGSSSAAIVGGLVAANEWARQTENRALERQHVLNLANQIEGHPDNVVPALLGGLVASVVGEKGEVTAVQVPVRRWPQFVVWIPDTELATKAARGVLPASYSRADAVFNVSRSSLLVAAFAAGDWDALSYALDDRMHQPFRVPLLTGWNQLAGAAREAGALGVTLSGSGPTILFWADGEQRAEAVRATIESAAHKEGLVGRALKLNAVETGAQVI